MRFETVGQKRAIDKFNNRLFTRGSACLNTCIVSIARWIIKNASVVVKGPDVVRIKGRSSNFERWFITIVVEFELH